MDCIRLVILLKGIPVIEISEFLVVQGRIVVPVPFKKNRVIKGRFLLCNL
jgi:hypothetical protein